MKVIQLVEWDFPDYPLADVRRINSLTNSSKKNIPNWRMVSGIWLSLDQKIRRVYHYFDRAMESETEGKFKKADFFWKSCIQSFKNIYNNKAGWNQKEVFANTVLIPAYTGLINSYLEKEKNPAYEERIGFFLDQITKVSDLLQFAPVENREKIVNITRYQLRVYALRGYPTKAYTLLSKVNKLYPEIIDFAKGFIDSSYQEGLVEIEKDSKLRNSIHLGSLAENMETRTFPEALQGLALSRLSLLYNFHSVSLADQQNYSGALVAARKALVYNPSDEQIVSVWNDLIKRMKTQQVEIAKVVESISHNPRATLTPSGRITKEDADRGFGPVDSFIKDEEQVFIKKRETGNAYSLMNRMGILESLGENRKESAEYIYKIINELLANEKNTATTIEINLRKYLIAIPDLEQPAINKVCSFVHDLFDPSKPESAAAEIKKDNELPRYVHKIQVADTIKSKSEEPFLYWLFANKDWFVKGMGFATIMLVCITLFISGYQLYAERKRNNAYTQMNELVKEGGSFPVVLEKAFDFLNHGPILGEDQRTASVTSVYKRTLATWIMNSSEKDEPEIKSYISRFDKLTPSSKP